MTNLMKASNNSGATWWRRLWRKLYWSVYPLIKRVLARFRSSRNVRQISRSAHSRSAHSVKLELGSGRRTGRTDWLFSDWGGHGDFNFDFTKPIPIPDDSVDYLYSSHVLEHFSYPSPMLNFLGECRRILKPGGAFSVAVPDARIFINAYMHPDEFDREKFCSWDVGLSYRCNIDYVNFIAYLGGDHKHLFDDKNLVSVLEEVGFRGARIREFEPDLDLVDRKHESIYAVATK
jgi:predicted SAM-dependent methyltransferase